MNWNKYPRKAVDNLEKTKIKILKKNQPDPNLKKTKNQIHVPTAYAAKYSDDGEKPNETQDRKL